jgi:hypothetical protein
VAGDDARHLVLGHAGVIDIGDRNAIRATPAATDLAIRGYRYAHDHRVEPPGE